VISQARQMSSTVKSDPENRRTSTRHRVDLRATLLAEDIGAAGLLTNLSLGGALVATWLKRSLGDRVRLMFFLPTLPEMIEITAVVRWAARDTLGLQFDGLRAREIQALREHLTMLESARP